MGRVSREARLTFILLWPQCDDAGRIRANSRMLASVLFPYDEDAPTHIDGWLSELEKDGCIVRYQVDNESYLAISTWSHQKIDHPSPSKLPPPSEKKQRKTRTKPREEVSNDSEASPKPRAVSSTVPEGTVSDRIVEESTPAPADDIAQAIAAYNLIAAELGWPAAVRVTPLRISSTRKRLLECGGIGGWRDAMAKARASPYLRGETKRAKGFEDWAPDLDFFLQQSSFTKLLEGKYDQRGSHQQPDGFDALAAGMVGAARVDRRPGQGMEGPEHQPGRIPLIGNG